MKTSLPMLLLLAIVILSGLLTGCFRRSSSYTENDVRRFVQPGTSREAIEQRFGRPTVDDKDPSIKKHDANVDEVLVFVLRPESQSRGKLVFGGFEVDLKNGKAVNWMAAQARSN